jgi:hypothetical protein
MLLLNKMYVQAYSKKKNVVIESFVRVTNATLCLFWVQQTHANLFKGSSTC